MKDADIEGPRRPAVFDPSVPLQHQVYLQLKQEIVDGLWVDRTDFPGEKELAQRYGVSVITTQAALGRLADEGWVERRRGRGTRVVRQPPPPSPSGPTLLPLEARSDYRYRLLSAEEAVAPAEACRAFGVPEGSILWQCRRLRTFEGRSHSVTHNVQREEIGRRHRKRALASLPMSAILESEGLTRARIRRHLAVSHASPEVAGYLGLTLADPVLQAVFTVEDPSGHVLEWVRICLHPDFATPEEVLDLRSGAWRAARQM